MAGHQLGAILRQLRRVVQPAEGGIADAELLERFIRRGDEAAFESLMQRHGPMVLGVCRRVLRDRHDAEDAFQAAFLVLVRKAASVQSQHNLASWLYGVARRTALEARRAAARRRAREGRAVPHPETKADSGADLRDMLDLELARLPDRYRAVIVLCHLEGKTRREAAKLLGVREGTVSSRPAALGHDTASACVAPALAASTLKVVLVGAAVQPAVAVTVPATVAALTERVLQAMYLTKLKLTATALLTLTLIGASVALFAQGRPGGESGPAARHTAPPRAKAPRQETEKSRPPSVRSMPPVVVRTVPEAGDTEVNAARTTAIQVTFSKEMMDGSWSWSQVSDETFPKVSGKPHYDKGRRTCILPVKLAPGKTYVLWLNSARFGNFKDADGRSAVPYLLVFETAPDPEESLYSLLRKDHMVAFPEGRGILFVENVRDRKLVNPILKKKQPNGDIAYVAHAREGDLRVDLRKREVGIHMKDGAGSSEDAQTYFSDRVFVMPLPARFGQK